MKPKLLTIVALTSVFTLQPSALLLAAPLGTAFTYQGRLNEGGIPATGIYDLRFTIYDALGGGGAVAGPLTNSPVGVTNGVFTVTLDFGSGVFTGDARWLEIGVRSNGVAADFTTLSPRQNVTPSPYALYAPGAGVAASAATVTGSVPASQLTGTISSNNIAPSTITGSMVADNSLTGAKIVDGTIADADIDGTSGISGGKIIGGDLQAERLKVGSGHTLTGDKATIAGGLNNAASTDYAVVGGGQQNVASGNAAAITGGKFNTASGQISAIGGGLGNNAAGYYTTVGGGLFNSVSNLYATVAGGFNNVAGGDAAAVAGGSRNTASGHGAFIGGGGYDGITEAGNVANGPASVIAGGISNTASNRYATVGGGVGNTSGGDSATVGGGGYNSATASHATVGGGSENSAGPGATVGGGVQNTASGSSATVGGGEQNTATQNHATVAGGYMNTASGYGAVVGGGGEAGMGLSGNLASGNLSVVGGGSGNRATNAFAAIPGGANNLAGGQYALASGRRAKANHTGAFVWGDSMDADFASTSNNQFLIRASGGVGIGTNNPQSVLHVAGAVTADSFSGSGAGLTSISIAALPAGVVTNNQTGVALNGTFNAATGLIIENRASDPPTPAVGQVWLRTDL